MDEITKSLETSRQLISQAVIQLTGLTHDLTAAGKTATADTLRRHVQHLGAVNAELRETHDHLQRLAGVP